MPINAPNVESVLELWSLCLWVCLWRPVAHLEVWQCDTPSCRALQMHLLILLFVPPTVRMPIFSRYFQPVQLFVGAMVVTLLFLGFVWAAENQAPIRRFRRNHPSITVFGILFTGYLFMSVLGGVAVFLFGVAFPILSKTTHTHQNPKISFNIIICQKEIKNGGNIHYLFKEGRLH